MTYISFHYDCINSCGVESKGLHWSMWTDSKESAVANLEDKAKWYNLRITKTYDFKVSDYNIDE